MAQGLAPRHAIKQVDRLLSNPKLSMEQVFGCWVPFVVGERREIFINFDWTEFEDADQCTVVLGMQTEHGRSTPLVWKTVTRSALKENSATTMKTTCSWGLPRWCRRTYGSQWLLTGASLTASSIAS